MYQVIPRRWLTDRLDVWFSIWQKDPPGGRVECRISTNGTVVQTIDLSPVSNWRKRGAPPEKRIWHTWRIIHSLQPGTEYTCELLVKGTVRAIGIARTLPRSLPSTNGTSRPFNVFVGSCYFLPNDPNKKVPAAYMKLWNHAQWRPDVKFLCGDQIYFDCPPTDFFYVSPSDPQAWIRKRLTQKYRQTWRTLDPLLSRGITYFLTDDHEYWNDYPDKMNGGWVFATHTAHDYLKRRTEAFANDFQWAGAPAEGFQIGNLNFWVLDTRRHRSLNQSAAKWYPWAPLRCRSRSG